MIKMFWAALIFWISLFDCCRASEWPSNHETCFHEDNMIKVVIVIDGEMEESNFTAALKDAADFVQGCENGMKVAEMTPQFGPVGNVRKKRSVPEISGTALRTIESALQRKRRSAQRRRRRSASSVIWASQMKHHKHDVIFMLDGSNSTGNTSFEKAKEFIVNFTRQIELGSDKTRVSVIQYSSEGIFIELSFSDSIDRETTWIETTILDIPFRGGAKKTSEGLEAMKHLFDTSARVDVFKVVIILTDGKEDESPPLTAQNVDVVFLFDITGSMSSELGNVKGEALRIVEDIKETYNDSLVRVAFIGYRDTGDAQQFIHFDFNENFTIFQLWLMKVSASGGGDAPENIRGGIDQLRFNLTWSDNKNSTRVIVGVADQPGHGDWNTKGSETRRAMTEQLLWLKCELRISLFLFIHASSNSALLAMLNAMKEDSKKDCDGSVVEDSNWFITSSVKETNIVDEIVTQAHIIIKTVSFQDISLELQKAGVEIVGVGLSPQADDEKLRDIVGDVVVGKENNVIIGENLAGVMEIIEKTIVEEVDFCALQPCFHNGTCLNESLSFRCICADGFKGVKCETSLTTQFAVIVSGDDSSVLMEFNSDIEALDSLAHPGKVKGNLTDALQTARGMFETEEEEDKDPILICVIYTNTDDDLNAAAVAAADEMRSKDVIVLVVVGGDDGVQSAHEKVAGNEGNVFTAVGTLSRDLLVEVCREVRKTAFECHVDVNGHIYFRVYAKEHYMRSYVSYIGWCPVTPLPSDIRFKYYYQALVTDCGAEFRETDGQIVYNNSFTSSFETNSHQITRDDNVGWNMFCFLNSTYQLTASFVPLSPEIQDRRDEVFPYVGIDAYHNASFAVIIIPPIFLEMNELVYFRVWTDLAKRVFLTDCWSTPERETTAVEENRYYLLKNGCPLDPTFRGLPSEGVNETRFAFAAFRFIRPHYKVYIYCEAVLCALSSKDSRCDLGCEEETSPSRRRRALPEETVSVESGPFILGGQNCDRLDDVPNAEIVCSNATLTGSVCRIECSPGFRLENDGHESVTCLGTTDGNEWSAIVKGCREQSSEVDDKCTTSPGDSDCVCREGYKKFSANDKCSLSDRYVGSLRILTDFDDDMHDKETTVYQETATKIENTLTDVITSGMSSGDSVIVSVMSLSPGSVVANYEVFLARESGKPSVGAETLGRLVRDRILATNGTDLGIGLQESDFVVEDPDECQREVVRNECHDFAECVDTEGSFECRCRQGYRDDSPSGLEGRFCVRLEEKKDEKEEEKEVKEEKVVTFEGDEQSSKDFKFEAMVGVVTALLVVIVLGGYAIYRLKKSGKVAPEKDDKRRKTKEKGTKKTEKKKKEERKKENMKRRIYNLEEYFDEDIPTVY